MPNITQIVAGINAAISTGIPVEFAPAVYLGVAYPYPELNGSDTLIRIIPAIIDNETGEGTELLTADDTEAIKIYHRIVTNQYQYVAAPAGNRYLQKWTGDMYLVVIAMRSAVKIAAEELEQLIIASFPFTVALASTPGITNLELLPYLSEMDFISVFKNEFPQVPYFLKPDQILFKIRYRITADVDPRCLNSLN